MEEIMLCNRPGKCCPVLAKKGRKYTISDKGQKIEFTKTQLCILSGAITKYVGVWKGV